LLVKEDFVLMTAGIRPLLAQRLDRVAATGRDADKDDRLALRRDPKGMQAQSVRA
jgi:hypothetical protein